MSEKIKPRRRKNKNKPREQDQVYLNRLKKQSTNLLIFHGLSSGASIVSLPVQPLIANVLCENNGESPPPVTPPPTPVILRAVRGAVT